jgi:hypothetical protein
MVYLISPIIFMTFFIDRLITSVMWWSRWKTMKEWFQDSEAMAYSIIRVVFFMLFYGLYKIWF